MERSQTPTFDKFFEHLSLVEIKAVIQVAKSRADRDSRRPPGANLTERELLALDPVTETIARLQPKKVQELTALAWLGRSAGGENASDWDRLKKQALADEHYLGEKTPLAEYLEAGLKELGIPKKEWPPV